MLIIFFFNDPATTEIYTLSLHDALPISAASRRSAPSSPAPPARRDDRSGTARRGRRDRRSARRRATRPLDRKSTRLNSSHANISYAVFCLKKKQNLATLRRPPCIHYREA